MTTHAAYGIGPGKSRRGDTLLLRGGYSLSCKVSGTVTEGRTAIFEGVVPPGAGPVLHLHYEQNEWWYILDGEFLFQVGDQRFRAQPGASVFGPRTVPHAFRCVSKTPGKMLFAFDPAGQMEEFFGEIARSGIEGSSGAHHERDLFQRFGMEAVGPPLNDA